MTREELREHCEKQIEMCEFWAISKGEKPSGKIYEEHKLILELLEQESRWIPVSERLPKAECGESDSVLVCFENETQDVLYFNGSNWCYPTGEIYISVNHKNGWHNKVVAWMPLPKPYEPQEREDI